MNAAPHPPSRGCEVTVERNVFKKRFNSPLSECPHCEALIDITDLEPLAQITCPGCQQEITVRESLAHFRVVDVAGNGGMGMVYRAVDTSLGRAVALKVLRKDHSQNKELVAKLKTEAKLTAAVNHPNVITIFSTGIDHGRFYIAMELADRGSLDECISRGKMEEAEVLAIAIQIASGLRAAHEHGLIHRDVSPGNVLFDDKGIVKLVDFGLAVPMSEEESVRGETWGTPFYIAPEKLEARPEDFRSDIYSLGGILFHALAGRPPFEADTLTTVCLEHFKCDAPSIKAVAPWISRPTAKVINRMLHRRPEIRHQSYDELIEELEAAEQNLIVQEAATQPAPEPERPKTTLWRLFR